jgi:hypothetical protein
MDGFHAHLQAVGCICGRLAFIGVSGCDLSGGRDGIPRRLWVAFHIIPSTTVTFIGNTLTGGGVIVPSSQKPARTYAIVITIRV